MTDTSGIDWGDPPLSPSSTQQYRVLSEALAIYQRREAKRGDAWKEFGWRGCLFNVRVCAQRAWRSFWSKQVPGHRRDAKVTWNNADVDDLLDLINYAAMTIRAIREGNRDGNWDYGAEED